MGIIENVSFYKPENFVGEVTLIGTGGYGESCVVHLGCGHWIVVDSCIDPETGSSVPLLYLKEIGVDLANDVKLVVCTHWHDDHIQGLSELYNECTTAKFCIADTIDLKKFLYLVSLDYSKYTGKISNSSTGEFNKCIDEVRRRKGAVKKASKNKTLYTEPLKTDLFSSVVSLSPSDFAVERFSEEISTLISNFGENRKIVTFDPNSNSVVLLIKLGVHRVILGADLEVNEDDKEGWLNILNHHENIFDKKSTLFKISHHGSNNGYHERVWLELLDDTSVAKLTPYNKGYGLPTAEMLNLYLKHTNNLFITSSKISPKKPKKRDKQIEKIIAGFNSSLREIKFDLGIIRSRISLSDSQEWQTELYGNAVKVQA